MADPIHLRKKIVGRYGRRNALSAQGLNARSDEYQDAVADAVFVQFFSPVFGIKESRWDNEVKRVIAGTENGYTLNYGNRKALLITGAFVVLSLSVVALGLIAFAL